MGVGRNTSESHETTVDPKGDEFVGGVKVTRSDASARGKDAATKAKTTNSEFRIGDLMRAVIAGLVAN